MIGRMLMSGADKTICGSDLIRFTVSPMGSSWDRGKGIATILRFRFSEFGCLDLGLNFGMK